MEKLKILIIIIFVFLFSCTKKSGEPFLIYQHTDENTMVTANNELIFVSAFPDTLLSKKTDFAEIQGEIYTSNTNVTILEKGHVYKAVEDGIIDSLPSMESGALKLSTNTSEIKFTNQLRNLLPGTEYYARSFAKVQFADGKIITGYNSKVLHFNTESVQNKWDYITNSFPGKRRTDAIKFKIENKVYVGLGFDGAFALGDIWAFNYSTLAWSPISTYPGKSRYGAVAFVINNIGYIALGVDGDGNYLKECWAFDASIGTNGKWKRIADFPGTGRKKAVAFVLNNEGHIATGVHGTTYTVDVWKYDPTSDNWINNDPDLNSVQQREGAVSFVIDNYAYIGFGRKDTTVYKDFYKIDAKYFNWGLVSPSFPGKERYEAMAFAALEGFYIGGGKNNTEYLNDFWYYDPYNSKWLQKANIVDTTRIEGGIKGGVGFFIGEYGFIGLGETKNKKINYFWQYLP